MKAFIITLMLAFCISSTFGQQIQVEGYVTDENNEPFANAKVLVAETGNETHTDEEGMYTIEAEVGQHLVFSHAGYHSLMIKVEDKNPIDLKMERDNASIIARVTGGFAEKKAQGYSVSTICGSQIAESPQSDFSRIIEGKTAGIRVRPQTGFVGSTNSVVIRGLSSINGSNHPLYVIDGVPYDTQITNPGNVVCGDLGTNRSFDIDPNNIASVKVLKGLAATNMYGSQGRNGVVVISTKTGPYANR
ncbi:MAG: hypothetical protein Aureis2KO_16780 [Aureisphaera sp.]